MKSNYKIKLKFYMLICKFYANLFPIIFYAFYMNIQFTISNMILPEKKNYKHGSRNTAKSLKECDVI